jgi:tetratricopeptide (TPR) repeat protein
MLMSNIRISNGNKKSNIKISIDRTGLLDMQNRVNEASSVLNDYITRRKNQEWMSEDDISNYRSALDRYKSSYSSLANIQRISGDYNEDDDKERNEWLSNLSTDFDSASEIYGQYKSIDDYNNAIAAYKEREGMKTANLDDIRAEINDLEKLLEDERGNTDHGMFGWAMSDKQKDKRNPKLSKLRSSIDSKIVFRL